MHLVLSAAGGNDPYFLTGYLLKTDSNHPKIQLFSNILLIKAPVVRMKFLN